MKRITTFLGGWVRGEWASILWKARIPTKQWNSGDALVFPWLVIMMNQQLEWPWHDRTKQLRAQTLRLKIEVIPPESNLDKLKRDCATWQTEKREKYIKGDREVRQWIWILVWVSIVASVACPSNHCALSCLKRPTPWTLSNRWHLMWAHVDLSGMKDGLC